MVVTKRLIIYLLGVPTIAFLGTYAFSRPAKQTHLPRLDGSLPRLKVEVQVSDDGW